MKKLFITVTLMGLFFAAHAQTGQPAPKQDTVVIKIPADKLNALQQVLQYSFQYLPTSDGKAKDVGMVVQTIRDVFPFLVPAVADTSKKVKPAQRKK